jgi:hypothetical protein
MDVELWGDLVDVVIAAMSAIEHGLELGGELLQACACLLAGALGGEL